MFGTDKRLATLIEWQDAPKEGVCSRCYNTDLPVYLVTVGLETGAEPAILNLIGHGDCIAKQLTEQGYKVASQKFAQWDNASGTYHFSFNLATQ